jgi:putative spermidine/putrescine transport system permease protein
MSERARALRVEAAGPLGRRGIPVLTAATLVLVFLALPNTIVVPISFSAATYLTFPPPGWSTQWYARYFESATWMRATWRSVQVAVLTMGAATVLGVTAALALRRPFRGRQLAHPGILLPMVVPAIITAIGIYDLYARWGLTETILGLVIAHTVLALPFVVVVVGAALRGLDGNLELAAQSLGANRWQTYRHVTLPLIQPGILSAAILAFMTSFDEVVVAIFISGARSPTLPKQMWDGVRTEIDPTIAAVSSLLVGASSLLLLLSVFVLRKRRG